MGSCDNRVDHYTYGVAMNAAQYGLDQCRNGACVEIRDVRSGAVRRLKVVDRCAGCPYGGLDFTYAAAADLGRINDGVWEIEWRFC